jgi:hypothetical protein
VESVGAVPIASLPFVPPPLRLVRLCLFHPEEKPRRQRRIDVNMKHAINHIRNTYIDSGPSLIGSYCRQWGTLASSLSLVQRPVCE